MWEHTTPVKNPAWMTKLFTVLRYIIKNVLDPHAVTRNLHYATTRSLHAFLSLQAFPKFDLKVQAIMRDNRFKNHKPKKAEMLGSIGEAEIIAKADRTIWRNKRGLFTFVVGMDNQDRIGNLHAIPSKLNYGITFFPVNSVGEVIKNDAPIIRLQAFLDDGHTSVAGMKTANKTWWIECVCCMRSHDVCSQMMFRTATRNQSSPQ